MDALGKGRCAVDAFADRPVGPDGKVLGQGQRMRGAWGMIAWAVFAGSVSGLGAAAEPDLWPSTVEPGAGLVEIFSEDRFFEGPTWDPVGNKLYFTAFSQTNQQILRLEAPGRAVVWLDRTEGINGTFLSNDGKLLGAQAYGHRLMMYGFGTNGPSEVRTLLFDPTLHQPNDLCQTPRGDIYFTDPDFKNRKTSAVYRYSVDGQVTRVISDMAVPNGIAASPRGRSLYVSDSHAKHWREYPINRDGTVGEGKVFFKPETEAKADPDGMTVDEDGNLYLTGMGGIWVVNSKGKMLGFIEVPEFCSNVAFGGVTGKTLFITCSKKLYQLEMKVHGALYGKRLWQLFQSAE